MYSPWLFQLQVLGGCTHPDCFSSRFLGGWTPFLCAISSSTRTAWAASPRLRYQRGDSTSSLRQEIITSVKAQHLSCVKARLNWAKANVKWNLNIKLDNLETHLEAMWFYLSPQYKRTFNKFVYFRSFIFESEIFFDICRQWVVNVILANWNHVSSRIWSPYF